MDGFDHCGAGVRRLEHVEALVGHQGGADRLGPPGVFERHLQCRGLDLVIGVMPAMSVRGEDPDHAATSWGLRPQTPSPSGSLAVARPVALAPLTPA